MKITARILSLLMLVAIATFSVSCGGDDDDDKSAAEKQIDKLVGTWTATTVTFEGNPHPLEHTNFQLVITASGSKTSVKYEAKNRPVGPSAWPGAGTFEFGTNPNTTLIRDDEANITYTVSGQTLTMSFTFSGEPYPAAGRVKNVAGNWYFEFTKQ